MLNDISILLDSAELEDDTAEKKKRKRMRRRKNQKTINQSNLSSTRVYKGGYLLSNWPVFPWLVPVVSLQMTKIAFLAISY